ncbi:MAG: hypothetical protein VW440_04130 [Bordetella sp.]
MTTSKRSSKGSKESKVAKGSKLSGPNCWGCRFFAISWDPGRPYACQLMGFKTNILPCIEVLRTDGRVCHGFSPKSGESEALSNKPGPKKRKSHRGRTIDLLIE